MLYNYFLTFSTLCWVSFANIISTIELSTSIFLFVSFLLLFFFFWYARKLREYAYTFLLLFSFLSLFYFIFMIMCWKGYNVTWLELVVDNVVKYSHVLSIQGESLIRKYRILMFFFFFFF